jgi:hypothetical protein
MIIVETPLRTLEQEILALENCPQGPQTRLYARGALQALRWVKDGGIPASHLDEVFTAPGVVR